MVYTENDKLLWTCYHMVDKVFLFTEDLKVTGVVAFAAAHQRIAVFTVITKHQIYQFMYKPEVQAEISRIIHTVMF